MGVAISVGPKDLVYSNLDVKKENFGCVRNEDVDDNTAHNFHTFTQPH
jgi:hypothetical protein